MVLQPSCAHFLLFTLTIPRSSSLASFPTLLLSSLSASALTAYFVCSMSSFCRLMVIDVKHAKCTHEGCKRHPTYNYENEEKRLCCPGIQRHYFFICFLGNLRVFGPQYKPLESTLGAEGTEGMKLKRYEFFF
jgi:hypothetical protein